MKAPNITLAFRLSIATFVLPVIVSALITGLGYFQLKGSNARLDYFLVSESIWDKVTSAEIHDQIMGSDHCPISLELNL